MKRLILLIPLILLCFVSQSQLYQDADSAFRDAAIEQKAVLLYFSGSDWCANCRRFEKNILEDTLFLTYSAKKLVILQADFPEKSCCPNPL